MTEGLYKGDCLEWLRSLPDGCAELAIVDGPYNMRKASWDEFDSWGRFRAWYVPLWAELSRVLGDSACMYVFGSFKSLAELNQDVEGRFGWELRQSITWDKGLGAVAGRCGDTLRMHPAATEMLAFYARERVDASALAWDGATREDNPLREYLNAEREGAGFSCAEINGAWQSERGGSGCMASHWFGQSQWQLPTRENYEWLRSLLNQAEGDDFLRRDYEDLRREYEDLRREYEDLRYPFTQLKGVTDVWQVPTCAGSERIKLNGKTAHVAQKPVEIMRRIVESSSRPGHLVLDPFLGLGSSAVACIRLGRRWAGAEITEEYWPIIEARVAHAERTRQPELGLLGDAS